jgi:acyl carrier protein
MIEGDSINNLIQVIREFHRIPQRKVISEKTLIEKDLGITGDDGVELIEEIEKIYGISFAPEDFGLTENESLFHSEGASLSGLLYWLLGRDNEYVKALTVGQLHEGLLLALGRVQSLTHHSSGTPNGAP